MRLPVEERRSEIMEAIRAHQIVVLSSETGTGKTTQIPKYIFQEYGQSVVCSQPRRIAAISIAKRVAEEMSQTLGGLVGYSVRFEDRVSEDTKIRYVTDGVLLRDFVEDKTVRKYKAVIIDEVHERTINIDLLLGLVKSAVKTRPDLKVVIMSATMNTDIFLDYFPGAIPFFVETRSFLVEIRYSPSTNKKYVEHALDTVWDIHMNQGPGDILVFLTGEDEIEQCCREVSDRKKSQKTLTALPLYASLPLRVQSQIFEPTEERKVIFATNIAETSVTIESIVFVVDAGYAKQKVFDAKMKSEMLLKLPISKSSANQRKGRAGRVRPGICYRLYDQQMYSEMEECAIPEILRGELSALVLKMARLGTENLACFDFIEPPLPDSVIVALNQLYFLGAITGTGEITEEGHLLEELPLEPKDSKALLQAARYGVAEEVATLCAVAGCIFTDRYKFRQGFEEKDHLTLYTIVKDYEEAYNKREYCRRNGINEKTMDNALRAKKQLLKILDRICPQPDLPGKKQEPEESVGERVERALLSGYLLQTAVAHKEQSATLIGTGAPVKIRWITVPEKSGRSRSCRGRSYSETRWVLYNELTKMDGKYVIRIVSTVSKPTILSLFRENENVLGMVRFRWEDYSKDPARIISYA